jgi:hypothetical protein
MSLNVQMNLRSLETMVKIILIPVTAKPHIFSSSLEKCLEDEDSRSFGQNLREPVDSLIFRLIIIKYY